MCSEAIAAAMGRPSPKPLCSVDKVIGQAEAYGHSRERELAFLTAHSMLHLFGYDHMEEEERLVMEHRQRGILESRGYVR